MCYSSVCCVTDEKKDVVHPLQLIKGNCLTHKALCSPKTQPDHPIQAEKQIILLIRQGSDILCMPPSF